MDIHSLLGQAGTPIRESGLGVLISPSASALASGGLVVLVGAGATGDSTGTAATPFTTMAGTTQGAEHFITGAVSTEEEHAQEFAAALMRGAAEFTTVRGQPSGRLTETRTPLADIPNHVDKAACTRGPSAVTAMAGRPETFRRAASLALAEEPAVEAVEAGGIDNPGQLRFQAKRR
jgi:hypothetical protein